MRRAEIDAWAVPVSGLAARPVTCLSRAGVATIGQLRQIPAERLLKLPGFGPVSVHNVQWFWGWCERLEAGTAELPDVGAWLREFLTPRQQAVLEQRFGLTDPLFRPWMRPPTLREIGGERRGGISRERVRQIEAEGLARLRSHLARALCPAAERCGPYNRWGVEWLQRETGNFLAATDTGA